MAADTGFMVDSRFRHFLCWFLVLSVGHCPLPCFDADWEDRGVPFDSVFDAHAWHPMLLGVAAPDDIDRGPFREDLDDGPTSPYGDSYVSAATLAVPTLDGSDSETRVVTLSAALLTRPPELSRCISRQTRAGLDGAVRPRCALPTLPCVMLV